MSAQLEYQRFPQPFFGIGIDAPESAEEWYEARSVIASVTARRNVARAVYAQLGYRYSSTTIRDADEGGVIERGQLLGTEGGAVSQTIGGGAWDSRDNVFAPTPAGDTATAISQRRRSSIARRWSGALASRPSRAPAPLRPHCRS